MGSFHLVPAEVAGPSDDVHFFETILADIAGEELAGHAVKRKAPGIAQTVSPDLGQAAGRSKRIVRRDRVLLPRSEGAVHVDPQDLAEQRLQVLSVALRIALAAAVAQADVEEPVGPESELAAIVVVERLLASAPR